MDVDDPTRGNVLGIGYTIESMPYELAEEGYISPIAKTLRLDTVNEI